MRVEEADKLKRGERVVRARFGVDDEICTGDHSCIRLSGCPSLTVKPNPDPLRSDPVATVIESCVGCGLCGEVAHAAVLCPSFYRAEIIRNPNWWDRALHRRAAPQLRRSACSIVAGGAAPQAPEHERAQAAIRADHPILIAALGGEGGGVLTDWIVAAAARRGLSGAVDLDPRRRAAHRRHHLLHRDACRCLRASSADASRCSRSRPASATSTSCMASELLEAGRAIANGLRHARPHRC